MARPPVPRGWHTLIGKANGLDVEGMAPEIARNKARPDQKSRTGMPWPVADDGTVVIPNYYNFAAMSDPDPLHLSTGGIWLVTTLFRVSGEMSADGVVDAGLLLSAVNLYGGESHVTVRLNDGDPFTFHYSPTYVVLAAGPEDVTPTFTVPTDADAGDARLTAIRLQAEV